MKAWGEQDVERLCSLVRMGMTAEECAREMGKTRHAVTNKAERMGLRFRVRSCFWSDAEKAVIANAPAHLSAHAASFFLANTNALPGRTQIAIREAILQQRSTEAPEDEFMAERRIRLANQDLLARLWKFHPEHAPCTSA